MKKTDEVPEWKLLMFACELLGVKELDADGIARVHLAAAQSHIAVKIGI